MNYKVLDDDGSSVLQTFKTKSACKEWLMEGMYSCEGAERDHFVDMLLQLEAGKKTLRY